MIATATPTKAELAVRQSAPEPRRFAWHGPSERAAFLVAAGELTGDAIAAAVGVAPRTLDKWKARADFAERVARHVAEIRERVRAHGIGALESRLAALDRRWDALHRVIDERAHDPAMANVPGGTTGLVVRTVQAVGRGRAFRLVAVDRVDTGLLRELRAHERQAARELGQWEGEVGRAGERSRPVCKVLLGVSTQDL